MTWTLRLDQFSHDLRIVNGKMVRVRGSDEVRQRVKVAIWHYIREYFLNVPDGVPWYESILGRKSGTDIVAQILRRRILQTPGVIRIVDFFVDFDTITRTFEVESQIEVQPGPGELSIIQPLTFNINSLGEVIA